VSRAGGQARLAVLAVAGALLTAAGCGSTAHRAAAPAPAPTLPRALAQSWAQQADAIATALAAGDGCTAEAQAVALRTAVAGAVTDGRVARRLAQPLVGAVGSLPTRIRCTPAPPAPLVPKHGRGVGHHGHGHDHKQGGGD